MMLEHLGHPEAGAAVLGAIETVLARGPVCAVHPGPRRHRDDRAARRPRSPQRSADTGTHRVSTLWLMATLVLTVVGDDRAGLVATVADVVGAHGGNWESSQLAELAGAFAGIIEVSVPMRTSRICAPPWPTSRVC